MDDGYTTGVEQYVKNYNASDKSVPLKSSVIWKLALAKGQFVSLTC